MNPHDDYTPPVEETVAHKTDVLAWDWLAGQECDLEYRLPFTMPLWAYRWMYLQLTIASAIAFPVGRLVGVTIAPLLSSGIICLTCVFSGAVWAMTNVWKQSTNTEEEEIWQFLPGIVARTCGPPIAWLAIVSTDRLDSLAGAYLYLLVALPVVVVVFDRLATHAVYWNTANLFASHAELTRGRTAWRNRLKTAVTDNCWETDNREEPTMGRAAALIGYVAGTLWVIAAYMIPRSLIALSTQISGPTIGLELVYGSFAGLFVTTCYRLDGDYRVVVYFLRMLAHWFYYGEAAKLPPWLFHSPCGAVHQRRVLVCLAVVLLSVHSSSLAAHSFQAIPIGNERVVSSQSTDTDWLTLAIDTSNDWLNRTLWIAPTILFAFCVPVLEFFMIGLILIGPVLVTYHRHFEHSEGE